MTKKLLILLFFLGSLLVESQNLVWNTDMSTAITLSNDQRKPLLIFFTTKETSDKIQNEIFKTADFQSWAAKNVILVKLDLSDSSISESVRDQNLSLKNAFGIDELPQVCYATASIRKGKTNFGSLGKIGYKSGNVQNWIYESDLLLNPE